MCVAADPGRPTIVQVVPSNTRGPSGVVDYAMGLAQSVRLHAGIGTIFVSDSPLSRSSQERHWQSVSSPKARLLCEALDRAVDQVEAQAVVVHFSGYGYQKRGVPIWLLNGLRAWRIHSNKIPIVTVFHELYAIGRVWNSSFWLSFAQRRIARSLLSISSVAICPSALVTQELSNWAGGNNTKIITMPVFSNVGEGGGELAAGDRETIAVVFGLSGVETRLYGTYRAQLERIISILGIEKIFDIGPRSLSMPENLGGAVFIRKGVLPSDQIFELLKISKFGLMAYPLDVIGKSGVFAAYAANGVIPIVFSERERRSSLDGIRAGEQCLDGLDISDPICLDTLEKVQSQAVAWYSSHSSKVQAESFVKALCLPRRAAGA